MHTLIRTVLIACATTALLAPSVAVSAPETARAAKAGKGWTTVTKYQGAKGQSCFIGGGGSYFNVDFRINATGVEKGKSKAVLSYNTGDGWKKFDSTRFVGPGETDEGDRVAFPTKPKIRIKVIVKNGGDRTGQRKLGKIKRCAD